MDEIGVTSRQDSLGGGSNLNGLGGSNLGGSKLGSNLGGSQPRSNLKSNITSVRDPLASRAAPGLAVDAVDSSSDSVQEIGQDHMQQIHNVDVGRRKTMGNTVKVPNPKTNK